jgi:hypothetical protein
MFALKQHTVKANGGGIVISFTIRPLYPGKSTIVFGKYGLPHWASSVWAAPLVSGFL